MLCKLWTTKRPSKLETKGQQNSHQKTKHACIVEAQASTRKRLESALPKDHEDHIAGKGFKSISHKNSALNGLPCLKG